MDRFGTEVWQLDVPAEVEALGDQAREAPDHHLLRDPRQELALGSFGTTDSEVLAEVLEHPVIVGKAITPFRQGVVGQGLRSGGVGRREVESGANTRRDPSGPVGLWRAKAGVLYTDLDTSKRRLEGEGKAVTMLW